MGASVKLTIAVKSTQQAVLDRAGHGALGRRRRELARPGAAQRRRAREYVTVEPGLAAQGLVEVRPVSGALAAGDLVIVGKRDAGTGAGAPPAASAGSTGTTGAGGTTGTTGTRAARRDGRDRQHGRRSVRRRLAALGRQRRRQLGRDRHDP